MTLGLKTDLGLETVNPFLLGVAAAGKSASLEKPWEKLTDEETALSTAN